MVTIQKDKLGNLFAILSCGFSFIFFIKKYLIWIVELNIVVFFILVGIYELFFAYVIKTFNFGVSRKRFIRICLLTCFIVSLMYLYIFYSGDLYWVLLQLMLLHLLVLRFWIFVIDKIPRRLLWIKYILIVCFYEYAGL